MSYRHLSRDFRVEHKVFILEVEEKSFGERIRVTERTRTRGYQISFDLGCAAWIVDQVKAALVTSGQNFFRKYKGHNYQFWVEIFHNKNGEVLVLSKTEKEGFVRNIFVPKGVNFFGWRSLEELLSEIFRGGKRAGATQRKVKRVGIDIVRMPPGVGPQASYRDVVIGGKTATTAAHSRIAREEIWKEKSWNKRDYSKESYSWGSVVVCERQVVHQPWREMEASLRNLLGTDIKISPFQCNKALFVCQNEEEATKIAQLGALAMKELPDVVLSGWWDSIHSNQRKAVSYGGWIALEGLPPHLWTNNFFQKIGDACGGLAEIDRRTANFGFLLEAKIKLKPNDTGFIPEFVEVADGELVFRVKIRQLSPAKRPNFPAEVRGITKSLSGMLMKDLKIQGITGTSPPATEDFEQPGPSSGTRACFRVGEFDCPVIVGTDRKQGLNRFLADDTRFEEPANPPLDSTYLVRRKGNQTRAESLTESARSTEESRSADATAEKDYFKNSKRHGSPRQLYSLVKGKGLEVYGKVDGGGTPTEGAQCSTSGHYFKGSKNELYLRSRGKEVVVSGPLVDLDLYPNNHVGPVGLDSQIILAGSYLGPIILNIKGLSNYFHHGSELQTEASSFLSPSAEPRWSVRRSIMPVPSTMIAVQQQRAKEIQVDGDPKRYAMSFKSKFFGRFGEPDKMGKW